MCNRHHGQADRRSDGAENSPLPFRPAGRDQQIGARVAYNEIDLIIFLRDPLTAQPHEPDINALLRLCDVHNIPLATNLATAEAMLKAVERGIWTGGIWSIPQKNRMIKRILPPGFFLWGHIRYFLEIYLIYRKQQKVLLYR